MLSPYRVLDLTNERGLLCGQILADLGADVVQVEPPGGARARRLGPFVDDVPHPDRSLRWWAVPQQTRHHARPRPRRRAGAFRAARRARRLPDRIGTPGVQAARGLAYADLAAQNPRLVYVSITAFGQDGPKARWADADLVVMAAGGPLL